MPVIDRKPPTLHSSPKLHFTVRGSKYIPGARPFRPLLDHPATYSHIHLLNSHPISSSTAAFSAKVPTPPGFDHGELILGSRELRTEERLT